MMTLQLTWVTLSIGFSCADCRRQADGRVIGDECQLCALLLGHWGVTPTTLAHAIMRDPLY